MRRRPVYYREADALFWGVEMAAPYIDASPFPLTVRVDQQPLQWVKHSKKGLVTAWRIERTAGVDYNIEYLPGPQNFVADACSRFPMLGPKRLTRIGLEFAFTELLRALPKKAKSLASYHLYAGRETVALTRALQRWLDA